MKRRYKVLGSIAGLLGLAIAVGAVVLSYESDCEPAPTLAADALPMRAVVARCYGSPDVLRVEDVAKPQPGDDQVLVKVHAASANPLDWHEMRGKPYLMRLSSGIGTPHELRLGVDFAGTVEAVGTNVTRFKPGDAVFGGAGGAFADYVAVTEGRALALKPDNIDFEQAATVGIAATTALQALRDKGKLLPGQSVLINGASGGVGTFAVQIAKALGAEVTAVSSTRNVELVRSLGADHVIDYTQQDFTRGAVRYDLIVDMVGNHGPLDLRRALAPQGTLVVVGGQDSDPFLGPIMGFLKAVAVAPFVEQTIEPMMASLNEADLLTLREWLASGKLKPVIDRRYPLAEAAEAIRYLEEGRARGKVVITVL